MIISITPDKEKAVSMFRLINNRESFVSSINIDKFPTNAAEGYYEIIKELMTAILLLEGKKSAGDNAHKEMIEEVARLSLLEEYEISLVNDLRIRRNKSSYDGKEIDKSFIFNKKENFSNIIKKPKLILNSKLNPD